MDPTDVRQPPPLPPRWPAELPPYAAIVEPRPASARALGILGMIFGSLALLTPLTAAMQMMMPANPGVTFYTPGRPPTTMAATFNPTAEMYARPMLPWTITSQAIGFALGAWLLWSAIQAFKLRERGRRGMLAYGVAMIAFAAVAGWVNAAYVMPRLFAGLAAPRGPMSAGAVQFFAVAVGFFGTLVAMIFPSFILVFFRRPHVVAAFAAAEQNRRV